MATEEKPAKAPGEHPGENPQGQIGRNPGNRWRNQFHASGLVWLLQIQPALSPERDRPMDTRADSPHSEAAQQAAWHGQRPRAVGIPKRMVCGARAVQSEGRPSPMDSIPNGNSLTGKLYAGNPPVQFGGRGSAHCALPTPMCDREVVNKAG